MRAIRHNASAKRAQLARCSSSASGSSSSSSSQGNKGGFRFGEALALAGGIGAAGVAITQGFVPHEWLIRHLSEPVLMPLVRLLDPETAHEFAVKSASLGLAPRVCVDTLLSLSERSSRSIDSSTY